MNPGSPALLRRGFSLVEILIVVVIVGILAALAIPKLANASQNAKESSLKDDLRLLRTQVGVFRTQHQDIYPGYPGGNLAQSPSAQAAYDQLTLFTDSNCNTSGATSPVFKWGPYVAKVPVNPVNNLTTMKILAPSDAFTPDDSSGWLYQPSTGALKANSSGVDSTGRAYTDY